METSAIEEMASADEKELRKTREPRVRRFAITVIVAAIVTLPILILTMEMSYLAYPSHTYEAGRTIERIRTDTSFYLIYVYICAAIALMVSYQMGSFVKSISLSRRLRSAVGAVLGPPAVMAALGLLIALVTTLVFDEGSGDHFLDVVRGVAWIFAWLLPWFAYIYVIRLLMSLVSLRWVKLVPYLLGIALMVGMVYPLALWQGVGDGEGQAFVAIAATMALSVLISAGLADLLFPISSGLTRARPKSSSA